MIKVKFKANNSIGIKSGKVVAVNDKAAVKFTSKTIVGEEILEADADPATDEDKKAIEAHKEASKKSK